MPQTRVRKVLIRPVLKKIDLLTSKGNSPPQRAVARLTKVSETSVRRAIKVLGKQKRRKMQVNQLTEKHKKNRRLTCKIIYVNYLTKDKSDFLVSLDEELFSLKIPTVREKFTVQPKKKIIPED